MNYLLLYTISPVQSFITQARKSRDLYGGSRLLSDIIEGVIDGLPAIESIDKYEVIFPHNETTQKPNRFLVELSFDQKDKQVVEAYLNGRVGELIKEFGEQALLKEKIEWSEDIANQLADSVKPYWVYRAIENKDKYEEIFKQLEVDLEAVKTSRSFDQLAELGRKCALSGEHNALFFRVNSEAKLPSFTYDKLKLKVSEKYGVNCLTRTHLVSQQVHTLGEGLSALQFIKRFYKQSDSFPSTARIAALDVINKIEGQQVNSDDTDLYNTYKDIFKEAHFDEQLLFEENLTSQYFEKHNLGKLLSKEYEGFSFLLDTNKVSQRLNEKLKKEIGDSFQEGMTDFTKIYNSTIKKILKRRNYKLNKYYGLILFDGDSMGKWMRASGVMDDKEGRFNLYDYHNVLSKLLGDFAKSATRYVDSASRGKTIYAGGDDFMAMLNLESLTETTVGLRKLFQDTVDLPLRNAYPILNWEKLSFSAGIVLAPYKMPLHSVLEKAKSAQNRAKSVKGKNAFSIDILKSSGDSFFMTGRWNLESENTLRKVQLLWDKVKSDFSTSFLRQLYDEFEIYEGSDNFNESDLARMVYVEAKRTLIRSYLIEETPVEQKGQEGRGEMEKKYEIEKLAITIKQLFVESTNAVEKNRIRNFLNFLSMIDFMKRKIN